MTKLFTLNDDYYEGVVEITKRERVRRLFTRKLSLVGFILVLILPKFNIAFAFECPLADSLQSQIEGAQKKADQAFAANRRNPTAFTAKKAELASNNVSNLKKARSKALSDCSSKSKLGSSGSSSPKTIPVGPPAPKSDIKDEMLRCRGLDIPGEISGMTYIMRSSWGQTVLESIVFGHSIDQRIDLEYLRMRMMRGEIVIDKKLSLSISVDCKNLRLSTNRKDFWAGPSYQLLFAESLSPEVCQVNSYIDESSTSAITWWKREGGTRIDIIALQNGTCRVRLYQEGLKGKFGGKTYQILNPIGEVIDFKAIKDDQTKETSDSIPAPTVSTPAPTPTESGVIRYFSVTKVRWANCKTAAETRLGSKLVRAQLVVPESGDGTGPSKYVYYPGNLKIFNDYAEVSAGKMEYWIKNLTTSQFVLQSTTPWYAAVQITCSYLE